MYHTGVDRIAAGFQESQDLKAAGFPQGTSFFRWYWSETAEPVLVPRHEKFQWAPKMKTGETDALCEGYPVDWSMGEYEWADAPSAEEQLLWKPQATLISLAGLRHATADGRVEEAPTLANALSRAIAPRRPQDGI